MMAENRAGRVRARQLAHLWKSITTFDISHEGLTIFENPTRQLMNFNTMTPINPL